MQTRLYLSAPPRSGKCFRGFRNRERKKGKEREKVGARRREREREKGGGGQRGLYLQLMMSQIRRAQKALVHHRRSSDFLLKNKKTLQLRKWPSFDTLQAYSWVYLRCPNQKSILHRSHSKISSANTFVHFFGDFST